MPETSPDGGRMAAAAANIACGAWPHAAAPSAATSLDTVRQGWRTAGRPPRKTASSHGAKLPPMLRNRLRGTAARGGRKSLAMASPSSRIHAMSIDQPWRNPEIAGHGQPFIAHPCDEHRPALAQQLRKAAGPLSGERVAIMRDYRAATRAIARSLWRRQCGGAWLPKKFGNWLLSVDGGRSSIRSTTGIDLSPISLHYKADGFYNERNQLVALIRRSLITRRSEGGGAAVGGGRIQLAMGPQPLWLRNHNFGLAQWIMVKRLATSPHDPLGITDSACKNQLVVVSVQYGPFNTYIPIRSTTIGKSRVAKDPIAMHTSWRSNSDIASVTRVSMTFRVVRTNQYNQDLGLIHSTNGNHLESPNEGSSIDHQVTIYMHAQNITMFPTNETWYFASQILVSSSGGLIFILTVQSTKN
ncbi:triacylglycerol lipase [Dorcoceras hygrometricum]|uniref:Triacylglycerol lipase n=1 Tax=Dorcoceras hygrometricum TaxID=472368 RepID=A0A2Z7BR27_9LAMI|nr:triacylglycerol lipase [Dorcoceras hygrometricum]